MNAIPTSREDQLQLSRDLIKQTVLKPNEHNAPPKIGISLWVPFYDAAHHKVRFLDVLKETWAKQGLRAFEGLIQEQSSDPVLARYSDLADAGPQYPGANATRVD